MTRSVTCVCFIFFVALGLRGQTQPRVLATAAGHTFTVSDLAPNTQNVISSLPETIAKTRSELLDQMVSDELVAAEAKARGIDVSKLVSDVKAKSPAPTETEISAIYLANVAAFDNKPLSEVREQLVTYLKAASGQKELQNFTETLRPKYKVVVVKDINAPALKPADVLVTVNGKAITDREFEEKNKLEIYETKAEVSDQVLNELYSMLYSTLALDEARSRGIEADRLIADEITSKGKSDQERGELETAFRERLFAKYNVKVLYEEPAPVVQNISVGSGASRGPVNAPVTIVMFSDFQCPACSATDPGLKKVVAEFPEKVRFVVRNFPLVTRHEHAFRAALAAAAANAQGKFFEYTEILYKNQDALDDTSLKKYAAGLGLNMKQFDLDFNSEKTAADVRKDMADGTSYKIGGTPSIYVNGVLLRDLSPSGIRRAINRALKA